ncbi:MAG: hypothetical protein L6Q54_06830 [Leptospiraceae bacterium]|nr:hypothetical protein [Leptospiraceae bacterium]MCK6380952.1 hypothetical protein [Leptospiraceae bacterium]NUM40953.1 hypothetical protein [Leptospiraceae bacterium]
MNTNNTNEKKSSKNFGKFLVAIGGFSIFFQFVGTCGSFLKYNTWPHTTGVYTGKVSIPSPGRNTMPSCSHSYSFAFHGQQNTGTQFAECKYFFYGSQEVGQKYEIAYDPNNGKNVISKEILFGLDLYRFLSLFVLPFAIGFGVILWRKK